MNRDDVAAIEMGARAFYTRDTLAEIMPRIRQARTLAALEARRQDLLRKFPQAPLGSSEGGKRA